jgi:hypothetical protein
MSRGPRPDDAFNIRRSAPEHQSEIGWCGARATADENSLYGLVIRLFFPTLLLLRAGRIGNFLSITRAANSALTTAGAELHLTQAWSLLAKFDGEFAKGSQTYAGTGTLRYAW